MRVYDEKFRMDSLDKLIQDHPVLAMITKMTETKKSDRLDVNHLVESVSNAKDSGVPILNTEVFNKIEKIIDDDMYEMNSDIQMNTYFKKLDHLS